MFDPQAAFRSANFPVGQAADQGFSPTRAVRARVPTLCSLAGAASSRCQAEVASTTTTFQYFTGVLPAPSKSSCLHLVGPLCDLFGLLG